MQKRIHRNSWEEEQKETQAKLFGTNTISAKVGTLNSTRICMEGQNNEIWGGKRGNEEDFRLDRPPFLSFVPSYR